MSHTAAIIRPEIVAAKIAALKNLQAPKFAAAVAKQPRLIELAWSLQWHSMQAGGFGKFLADFLALFSDSMGTSAMHRIGKTDQSYTPEERRAVVNSFDRHDYKNQDVNAILVDFSDQMLGHVTTFEFCKRTAPDPAFVNKQNHSYFLNLCNRVAAVALPRILSDFCSLPDAELPDVWWFRDLPGALIEMLDAQAGRASQEIVMTQIATQIFDALDFAWEEKAMVELIGDSRFGKTEAVKAYCAMRPGIARLVKTPCDNCDRSLLEAIGEALGVELSLKLSRRQLKTKVEYVLKHCGLMLVLDESAWLIPQRYSPTTAPMRLNYIRSQVLENGCPVALVTTPQFFGPAAQRFERVTDFNMAQWKGRIMRTVQLPAELPEQDLAAIVNHHFPDINQACVRRVIGCALVSESYLFAVLKIAKNARAVAKKKGRATIQLDDLEAGIALAGITLPAQAASAPDARKPQPIAQSRRRSAMLSPITAPVLESSPCETSPILQTA